MTSADRITRMALDRIVGRVCAVVFVVISLATVAAQAPQAGDDRPKFEVAAVRPNTADDGKIMIGIQPGGRFNAVNVPLSELIRQAYGVQRSQLVGAPDWIDTARYDVVAKAEADIPRTGLGNGPGPLNLMLQDLLDDRFKLAAHRETRDMPIYALTFARADKTSGPGLRASIINCEAMRGRGRGGPAPGPPGPAERPQCGMRMAPGQIAAGGISIAQLVLVLSQSVQRSVIDRTALAGTFDVDLTWTPDRLPLGPPPPGVQPPSIDPNGPSLFTAIQEQLGLKLESDRGPVDVLVIDHVERATPD